MNEELTKQLQGYLESSTVEAVAYPFMYGVAKSLMTPPTPEPCLLVTSVAGGYRFTDVITPSGTTHVLSSTKVEATIEHGPDCRPEDMSEPDEEGLRDCKSCGLWEKG